MICGLILAAGRSQRMGVQKLLLPVGDRPLITRIVDEVLRSPLDQVFVVVGRDGGRVQEALAGRRVSFVTNTDWDSEMLQSVRCGLAAMPATCVAAMVILGDQPGLTADLATRLVRSFQSTGCGIVVPIFGGKRGHPILFSMQYRKEILSRHDEVGLRGLLQAHTGDVLEVETDASDILEDMDLPEDYQRTFARLAVQDPAKSETAPKPPE